LSLILPVHNSAGTLAETLESLRAQAFDDLEVIVVDDGSTDDSAALAGRLWPGAKVITQANAGPAAARNRGLQETAAPLVTFLDSDDLLPPGKLARQCAFLDASPATQAIVGLLQKFRLREGAAPASRDYEHSRPFFLFTLGCGIYRRALFGQVGEFDTHMRFGYSDDTDWMVRVMEAHAEVEFEQEVALYYRIHPGGITHGLDSRTNGFLLAVQRSIARRRARGGPALRQPDLPRDPSRAPREDPAS
jgi:glycosyltransferase involved in cell wall biosynthesis